MCLKPSRTDFILLTKSLDYLDVLHDPNNLNLNNFRDISLHLQEQVANIIKHFRWSYRTAYIDWAQ